MFPTEITGALVALLVVLGLAFLDHVVDVLVGLDSPVENARFDTVEHD